MAKIIITRYWHHSAVWRTSEGQQIRPPVTYDPCGYTSREHMQKELCKRFKHRQAHVREDGAVRMEEACNSYSETRFEE